MPFRIAKSFTVESGHLLTKHPGACRFPHGHSRTIEIVVVAEALDDRDMVCDFKALKLAATDVIARYDHAFALNTADPQFEHFNAAYADRIVAFAETDPTTEVLARQIYHQVCEKLAAAHRASDTGYAISATVRLERVRVTETGSSWAEYWE
jgi:6-pyruvoyltetrahydropterin/6-carboxytetrahydropterin synthase